MYTISSEITALANTNRIPTEVSERIPTEVSEIIPTKVSERIPTYRGK